MRQAESGPTNFKFQIKSKMTKLNKTVFAGRMIFLFLTCLLAGFRGAAQIEEAESRMQEIFIDASREKLLGNYDKAINLFQEVLQKDPQNDAAAFEIARVYFAQNKDEDAIRFCKKAIELEPDNIWYAMFLGDLFQKNNRDAEGAALYEGLVKKYPAEEDYYFKWAFFLVRAAEPDKAIKVYEELEKKMGVNEEVTRRKHALYLGMGDPKKAAKELEKLIAAFPKNTDYRHLLAGFYAQMGDKKSAENVYNDILKINPNDAQAKLTLAGGAKASGSESAFFNSLRPVFEDRGVDLDLKIKELIPLMEKLANRPDPDMTRQVLELTDILEKAHPNRAKVHALKGDLYFHSNQFPQAAEQYLKTLELDDAVYLVWEQLLLSYKELGDFSSMIKYSEKALDIFPNQAAIYYYNGLGYAKTGKYNDAVNSLEQALIMSVRNPALRFDVLNLLGETYALLKNYDRSNNAFEEALKMNAKDPELLNKYALTLANRGAELQKAKEMAALANDLAPKWPNYMSTYGWVLYKMKDYSGARDWMNRAVEGDKTSDPAINEHYGDVLFQLGQVDEAVNYWKKALDKLGASPALERKIAERQVHE